MSFYTELTPDVRTALANYHRTQRIAAEHNRDDDAFQRHHAREVEIQTTTQSRIALDENEHYAATAGTSVPVDVMSPSYWSLPSAA